MTAPYPALGIRLSAVSKTFGRQLALANVDLDVPAGSYVAVMGANGAGKTTLLKIVAGLAVPSRGSVTISGVEMRKAGPRLRAMVGFVSHETMLYGDLSGRDNLRFHGRLHGLPDVDGAVEASGARFGAASFLDRPVRTLSRGMRQRLALARALLSDPCVILLDEPYTGLDEAAAISLNDILEGLASPERVLMVTLHDVARALSGPQRMIALSGGRVVLDRSIHGEGADVADTYLELLRSEPAR